MEGGGSAANVAAWLAVAGARPGLIGRVGADERGAAAEAALLASGVETWLTVDAERPTGTCVVLVAPDGERSMVPDAGANDGLADSDLPDELLAPDAHLHVAGYALLRDGSREAARSAIARARASGVSVSVDPSSAALLSPAFLDQVAGAALLLPNAEEAAILTGECDPERAGRLLAERIPEVVVTLGADGALWTDGRDLCRVAAAPANGGGEGGGVRGGVVDTTGAGDAFAAGLLAARLGGAGPEAALRAGCRLAARAVRTPGARP
jgi:sugar/nucleoside kinase (ribokinase family)